MWLVRNIDDTLILYQNKSIDANKKHSKSCSLLQVFECGNYCPVMWMSTISGAASVRTGGPQKP